MVSARERGLAILGLAHRALTPHQSEQVDLRRLIDRTVSSGGVKRALGVLTGQETNETCKVRSAPSA
jgi:hypothetical protein